MMGQDSLPHGNPICLRPAPLGPKAWEGKASRDSAVNLAFSAFEAKAISWLLPLKCTFSDSPLCFLLACHGRKISHRTTAIPFKLTGHSHAPAQHSAVASDFVKISPVLLLFALFSTSGHYHFILSQPFHTCKEFYLFLKVEVVCLAVRIKMFLFLFLNKENKTPN